MKKKVTHPLATWDLTEFNIMDVKTLGTALGTLAKKWVFQLERCPTTGKQHYQIRFSLHKKVREPQLAGMLKKMGLNPGGLSATSTSGSKTFDYVMKEETRVDGPWTDEMSLEVPAQVAKMKTLFPWQAQMLEMIKTYEPEMRKVHVLVHEGGIVGGSSFFLYCHHHKHGRMIPAFEDGMDVVQFAMSFPPSKAYLIDWPRNMPRKKMAGFWRGIEILKSGYLFDKRHKGRDRLQSSPFILVKMNEEPDRHLLSKDRWVWWTIGENSKELVPVIWDQSNTGPVAPLLPGVASDAITNEGQCEGRPAPAPLGHEP